LFSDRKMPRGANAPSRTRISAAFAFVFTFLTVVAECSSNNSKVTSLSFCLFP